MSALRACAHGYLGGGAAISLLKRAHNPLAKRGFPPTFALPFPRNWRCPMTLPGRRTATGNPWKVMSNSMIQMQELIAKSLRDFKEGSIVKGRILEVRPREVLVDIGYKSEGAIPTSEFDDVDDLEVGDEVEVLLVRLENEEGMVILSKERAAYRQNWEKIVKVFQGDGLIKGKVKAVVKGGLTVNIGVEAFLPGSQ